jgi:hypothetical protein
MKYWLYAFAAWGWLTIGIAQAENGPNLTQNNIIFITLDGVRWQEVFRRPDPFLSQGDFAENFPFMTHTLAQEGILFGNVDQGERIFVANDMVISLPAYLTMFSGEPTDCLSNDCDWIESETFPERLVRELHLPPESVAGFTSWSHIKHAFSEQSGLPQANGGIEPFKDSQSDAELEQLNRDQSLDLPPWPDARYDKYTFAQAMRYLKLHRPRFMYIGLDDPDERGHRQEYPEYLASLRQSDQWLQQLDATLAQLGDYGRNTTLIVTTDHGRGDGLLWGEHLFLFPGSENIWMLAKGPMVQKGGTFHQTYSHLDIRPTIEALMDLLPHTCQGCGQVIQEIVR